MNPQPWVMITAGLACLIGRPLLAGGAEQAKGVRVVVLEGTPRQRGLAHGRALKEQIHQVLKLWKADLAASFALDADAFIERMVKKTDFLTAMRRWTPELVQEAEGIAEGAGVDFDTLYVFQLLDEVWASGPEIVADRCSSLGISRSGGQPTLIAQNMDLPPFYDGFQVVLHIKPSDASPESFVLSIPGFIGLNGVNNRSVAICANTLLQLSHCRNGLPVACVVRGVLAQRTEEEAAAFLHRVRHASGQNYVVGGLQQALDVECSANKVVRLAPQHNQSTVWHTNHPLASTDYDAVYRVLLARNEVSSKEANSRTRLDCLDKRLRQEGAVANVELIKSVLSSRDSDAYPISRPRGKQYAFTFASTIMVLSAAPELHITAGPPHGAAYEKLTFAAPRR